MRRLCSAKAVHVYSLGCRAMRDEDVVGAKVVSHAAAAAAAAAMNGR